MNISDAERTIFMRFFSSVREKRKINAEKFLMTNIFLTALFPVFIVCLTELTQMKSTEKLVLFIVGSPLIMIFNLLAVSMVYAVLLCVFKRTWIAALIEGVALETLSVVELFKYGANGNHLILMDMKLAANVKSLTSFSYIKITPMLVICVLMLFAYVFAMFWFNCKLNLKPSPRVITSVACVGCCAAVLCLPKLGSAVFSVFDIDATESYNVFKINEKFEHNGFISFLLQTTAESFANKVEEPEDYTPAAINELLPTEHENEKGSFKKPNVIVVMSEAFADFRNIEGFDRDTSAYDKLDKLAEKYQSGKLIVPTLGSYTVRTEFELIFGLPVKSLNDPAMPQRMLLDREQPTIASYYKEYGYSTYYIHSFLSTFYSRETVYANFGFDKLIFEDDFTVPVEYYNAYIDDSVIFNQIEDIVKTEDAPVYIHTTTMQNHQPYNQLGTYADSVDEYLAGLEKTLSSLDKMITDLQNCGEPTVVLFVGDHFPSFKTEDNIYEQLGINSENCSILYEQTYLLCSNFDLDESAVPSNKFSAFYAPYIMLDAIDAPGDTFTDAMLEKLSSLPIYSSHYDQTIPDDDKLDMLTYDRVLGEKCSDVTVDSGVTK